jgi:short-subunit dehydrogenase
MAVNQSRNVFLTGASSGIGLETARLLAANGWEVWGTSRDSSRLPRLPHFHPVEMDLLQIDSVRRGFTTALNEAGAFAALINNAGAGAFGPLDGMSAEMVREQFQVLVDAPVELIRLVLPSMRASGCGWIVNVTSLAAVFPIPFMAPYSAAKAALSSFTQGLRMELAGTPIRVVDVRPGDINTPFHDTTKKTVGAVGPDDQRRLRAAWETETRNMATAPSPQLVARAILRVIESRNPPPIVTVGGFFQAKIAPFAARFGSARLVEWVLRRYYGI